MVTNSSTKLLGLSPRRKNAIFFLRASFFLGQELPELPERDLTISLLPSEKELLSSYTNHSLVSKHHPQAQKTPLLSQRRVCHRETAQAVLRRFSAPKSKKRPDPEDSAIGHKVELSCAVSRCSLSLSASLLLLLLLLLLLRHLLLSCLEIVRRSQASLSAPLLWHTDRHR